MPRKRRQDPKQTTLAFRPAGRYADADRDCEVAAPRTWLLAKGWRRIGLIDPAEVPGGDG